VKCQRQIMHIGLQWSQHDMSMSLTRKYPLAPVMDFIRRRRLSVFGHVAWLTQGAPVHTTVLIRRYETALTKRSL